MGKEAKIGEYIIAVKTMRGKSKKDRRYRVKDLIKDGDKSLMYEMFPEWNFPEFYRGSTLYLISHNGRYVYSEINNFIIDIKYMRKRKLKKIKF